jgi:hypothetical protein
MLTSCSESSATPSASPSTGFGINGYVLESGEIAYRGTADFEQAGGFTISFVLSTDKTKIHDIEVSLVDYELTIQNGTIVTTVSGSSTSSYPGEYEVNGGVIDADFGGYNHLSCTLTESGGSGEISYTYIYTDSNTSGFTPIPFGSSAVSFSAIEQ